MAVAENIDHLDLMTLPWHYYGRPCDPRPSYAIPLSLDGALLHALLADVRDRMAFPSLMTLRLTSTWRVIDYHPEALLALASGRRLENLVQ